MVVVNISWIYDSISDLYDVARTLLIACAKMQARTPLFLRIQHECLTHIMITDKYVTACRFVGDKCVDYNLPDGCMSMLDLDIVEEILKCGTEDVCSFYNNCPFKDELKEIIGLYKVLDKCRSRFFYDMECINLSKVFARVAELKALAHTIKQLM